MKTSIHIQHLILYAKMFVVPNSALSAFKTIDPIKNSIELVEKQEEKVEKGLKWKPRRKQTR